MKHLKAICLSFVVVLFAAVSFAGDMGSSRGHDLDELWAQAQAEHDLARQDAVVLLEGRQVTWDASGTLTTSVHRVVWIGTSVGIRGYADLRVPWNTETSELTVEVLRTWRDGRWWPDPEAISETAVVHTLPHALNRADDYTSLRETMLLHDGVELPCIMETVYTITTTGLPGADGQFVMPQRDPAIRTELQVTVPLESAFPYEMLNGAPEPAVVEDEETVTVIWRQTNVPALRTPLSDSPAAFEPTVVWSSWKDWETLRNHWREVFDAAAVLDDALADSLQSWLEPAPSPWSRIKAVTDQVNRDVRAIHYPDRLWRFAPRAAVRTWATAYGHPLDRAVLAAALLREAGFEVTPLFVGPGHSLIGEGTARLTGMGDLHLSIKGDPAGLYDPDGGSLSGQAPLIGLPLWRTDQFFEPFLGNSQWPNRLEVTLTLELGEEGDWQGSGQFFGGGVFCPQGDMAGMEDGARDYLAGVIGGLIPGAELNRTNPEIFHQHQVIFGFGLDLKMPEPGADGRTRLVIGAPGHGLLSRLAGIPLHQDERESPVILAGPLEQVVKVRLKTGETEAAHLPETSSLVNEAGEFSLTASSEDGWLTITREIHLGAESFPAAMWPQLRALLLEEDDAANGTVLLD